MSKLLTICAVSGGRADYGLLAPVLRLLRDDPQFDLQLVLTGQHLNRSAGGTAARVRADGFNISAEVDMGLGECDDAVAITKSAARGLDGMAEALARLRPDLVLVLGDRYEIVVTAIAATIARLPIAHIAGGDVTQGAFDDSFRHSISKMSHLHFVTNEESARRLRQLGEQPERIHVTGSPGLDLVRSTPVPPREEFFASVGLAPKGVNLVVTFHPETLADDTVRDVDELLAALDQVGDDVAILFTGSNADPRSRQIDARIERFVAGKPSRQLVGSLGAERYFAALTYMDAVVGNSSSGLYEAPSFGIPTVNIGDRQTGRLKATSVIDCRPDRSFILAAIQTALTRGRKPAINPYGDGFAAARIVDELAQLSDVSSLLSKCFLDLEVA